MFDAAGGASGEFAVNSFVSKQVPKATSVDFNFNFCTFLVIGGQIKYYVEYTTSTTYTIKSGVVDTVGDYVHTQGAAGNATTLPKFMRKALDDRYPTNDIK